MVSEDRVQAYLDCMDYIRKAKTKEEFDRFPKEMAREIAILRTENPAIGYKWVQNAWSYYRKLNLE